IAGVIVPDMPAEESAELDRSFAPSGLVRVDLYAPTTPDERLARLLPSARGFVYCVSLTGVTGARDRLGPDAGARVARGRRHPTPARSSTARSSCSEFSWTSTVSSPRTSAISGSR